ncbi:unnamed protein product [Caenorhabditis angaria]|uniref:Uncharacterized protein n=1 Tax=Caenorhabditis angaria TaxID=860376 RepID=A0A9P1NBF3_9PELO|nr:unnamed protein product [Caenorhabditis angaria]
MIKLLIFSSIFQYFLIFGKKLNIDTVYKDIQFANFLNAEFNYSSFLAQADMTAEKYVPFQDTSNDTFFRVGLLHRSQLENYTKIRMEDQLGSLKNKPWMPIKELREEFANCALFKFGSFSEHDFKYDKGMYGWMNIMKFSCTFLSDKVMIFAMAFARTRFRLNQVYLRRQNKYWATSGRSLITRDVQKITEIFTIRFSEFVNDKIEEELKKHGQFRHGKKLEENPLSINMETFDELTVMYGRLRKHSKMSESRGHTFSTMAIGVKTRFFLTSPGHVNTAIEAISEELSDAPLQVLDNCNTDLCTYDNTKNVTFHMKTETHKFSKENAFIHTVNPRYTVVAYQVAKPYFVFETMKRKTAIKIVDVKQNYDAKADNIWKKLLDQQFTLAIHVHNQAMFPFGRKTS